MLVEDGVAVVEESTLLYAPNLRATTDDGVDPARSWNDLVRLAPGEKTRVIDRFQARGSDWAFVAPLIRSVSGTVKRSSSGHVSGSAVSDEGGMQHGCPGTPSKGLTFSQFLHGSRAVLPPLTHVQAFTMHGQDRDNECSGCS